MSAGVDVHLNLAGMSGSMAKILLVFLAEPDDYTLDMLTERCGIRDPKTLRAACLELEQVKGLLVSVRSAHGKQKWRLEVSPEVSDGRLRLEPVRPGEASAGTQHVINASGKPPGWDTTDNQQSENPRAGNAVPVAQVGKPPNWDTADNQQSENPRTGKIAPVAHVGKPPNWDTADNQQSENPRAGNAAPVVRVGKTPTGYTIDNQQSENPRAGNAAPVAQVGKSPNWDTADNQQSENPRAGNAAPVAQVGKSPNWDTADNQEREESREGRAIDWSEVAKRVLWVPNRDQIPEKFRDSGQSLLVVDSLRTESKEIILNNSLAADASNEQLNRLLLRNARLLFGKQITWHPSFSEKSLVEVLGWLAQALKAQQKGKIDRPWGLVYRGLQGGLKLLHPDKEFQKTPWDHLPLEYLRACGLVQGSEKEKGPDKEPDVEVGLLKVESLRVLEREQEPEQEREPEQEQERDEPAWLPDQEINEPALLFRPVLQDEKINKAWAAAIGLLEEQMPRSTFQARVRDTQPAAWDETSGLLSIFAKDTQTMEWLEDRLKTSARRLLCGILNRQVQVRFIVS